MWAHSVDKSSCPISCAIRKYGWANFIAEVVAEASSREQLTALERAWIAVTNAAASSVGYNATLGGHPAIFTEATRRKMSDAQKRNPVRYWLGKKRPDNAERNRKVFTGRPSWNAGTAGPRKKRISKPPPRKTATLAELEQVRRAAGLKGTRVRWERQRANGNTTKHSLESRARRSEAMKLYWSTPERKEHLRKAALKRWAKAG